MANYTPPMRSLSISALNHDIAHIQRAANPSNGRQYAVLAFEVQVVTEFAAYPPDVI